MGKVQFRINRGKKIPKLDEEYPVYFRYTNSGVIFESSIGFKVKVTRTSSFYDSKLSLCKKIDNIPGDHSLNAIMRGLNAYFMDQDRIWQEKGIKPTQTEIRAFYKSFNDKKVGASKIEFFTYFEQFIKDAENLPNVSTGKLVSPSTIKGYKATKSFLKTFNDEVFVTTFSTIDLDWYIAFQRHSDKKGLSKNYFGKHIRILKTVLNKAVENEVSNNVKFRHRAFKELKEESIQIYLNEEELKLIRGLDLSKDEKLSKVRDIFMIGAYTGLRVSDYNYLTSDHIFTERGVQMFKVKTKKTDEVVGIPLHPVVKEILKRNGGKPPTGIPDQTINLLIKEIGFLAELNSMVNTSITKGGKIVESKFFKHELIVTHTARRSFATNAYLSGVAAYDIMKITGHRSEKNFLKYIKASAEEVAIKMSQNSFFN